MRSWVIDGVKYTEGSNEIKSAQGEDKGLTVEDLVYIMSKYPDIVLDAINEYHTYRTCEAIIIEDFCRRTNEES